MTPASHLRLALFAYVAGQRLQSSLVFLEVYLKDAAAGCQKHIQDIAIRSEKGKPVIGTGIGQNLFRAGNYCHFTPLGK